jgi:hypothetical protein
MVLSLEPSFTTMISKRGSRSAINDRNDAPMVTASL